MNLNECTVILLNQRSTQMNEYFALMTNKRRNSSVSNTELFIGSSVMRLQQQQNLK